MTSVNERDETMKVVLIGTHQLSVEYEVALDNCLGVLLLASSIKDLNVECEVLDFYGHSLFHVIDPEEKLEGIVSRIVDTKPDVLGFSTMSNNLILAIDLCCRVKEHNPEIFTLLGGPGVSFKAIEILTEFSNIDAIVRGEADVAFPELIEYLSKGESPEKVKGLLFRNANTIIDNGWPDPIENLDTTPFPKFELLDKKHDGIEPTASIEIGRGCPFNCIFCSTSTYFKRNYRVKSVDRVLQEIDEVQKYLDQTMISFNHDLLTYNREYVLQLAHAIKMREKPLTWGASVRLDTIDFELLRIMRDAGCDSLFIGIEVATPRMQKYIRKGLDLSMLEPTIDQLLELDYGFTLSFIVGFPEENDYDLSELLSYALKLKCKAPKKVTVQIHVLCPEPGSDFYRKWNSNLVYDDYGSLGHTDFPRLEWTQMRETIKHHPDIFPIYYHVDKPPKVRHQYLKLAFLARLIEGNSSHSIREAYRLMRDGLSKLIFSGLDHLSLPPPERTASQIIGLHKTLRNLILKGLKEGRYLDTYYATVSETEYVLSKLLAHKDQSNVSIIHSLYDPMKLIDFVSGDMDESMLETRARYTAFLWDSEKEGAKTVEIPDEYGELLSRYI